MKRDIDLLDGVEHSSASTYAALASFKQAFKTTLGVDMKWVQHTNKRKAIERAKGSSKLPYAYFNVSALGVDTEDGTIQHIRRQSQGSGIQYEEGGHTKKVFPFPMKIAIEAFYLTDSLMEAVSFIERVSLVNATRVLSSRITYPNGLNYEVNVFSDSVDVPLPEVNHDDESAAGIYTINLSYQLKTKMLIFKDGPKINNRGQILRGIKFEPLQ